MFILGLLLGLAAMLVFILLRGRGQAGQLNQEQLLERLKESLKAISFDALSKNTGEFLKLAGETLAKQTQVHQKELENKKELIEQSFVVMAKRLEEVQELVAGFKEDRKQQFGALTEQLKSASEQTVRQRIY
jgi:DNA recombination protein RmuC